MLVPGEIVDQFRVTRAIGRGGMGEVFLARDLHLGRRVALKVVHPKRLGSQDALDRFLLEARITAQFSHPHIVAVYAAGVIRGSPYLALEYLEGQNLRHRLREGRCGMREALRISLAIAEALQEAHGHGVLHRDLKPENVLIPRDGRLRVVDFGIAKQIGRTADAVEHGAAQVEPGQAPQDASAPLDREPSQRRPSSGLLDVALSMEQTTLVDDGNATADTAQGTGQHPVARPASVGLTLSDSEQDLPLAELQRSIGVVGEHVVGTPRYMSPEQWQGSESTGATDVWALGLILYELLSGRLPYTARHSVALAVEVVSPEPVPRLPSLAEVPVELEALVMRCLDKNPLRRPSAGAVVESLNELLHWRQLRPRVEESPFRGLLPFDERHTDYFYGREAETSTFLERLRGQCVLPVVGHSGAGKSSFVQAGVLARLREQGPWLVLHMRPGDRPFQTLASRLLTGESTRRGTEGTEESHTQDMRRQTSAATPAEDADDWRELDEPALARSLHDAPATLALRLLQIAEREGARVLLLVDQLEELCTLVEDRDTQQRFMQAICTAADDPEGPVRVSFTLRDDFLSRLALGPEARAALGQVTVLRSPDDGALREILVRPLQVVGYDYSDPVLVDEMVAAVRGEPACLPLLQFTAKTLWERRDKTLHQLTRATYQEIGGVAGALAEHADGVLAGLPPDQVRTARELLLRLVTSEGTRRVLPRHRALDGLGPEAEVVLSRLTQARLVSVRRSGRDDEAEPVLELVHESLIRTWSRLARWIEESREQIVFLADVGQAAERWEKLGRRSEELLRGQALRDADRALGRAGPRAPELIRHFVIAGRALEQRAVRRRRLAVASLAVVAVVALALAAAFADQRSKARQRSEELRVQWATAQREGARAALVRGDLLEARAKLRMSLEGQDSSFGRALWWKLQHNPLRWTRQLETTISDVAFSPDGTTIAGASQDRTVYLFDATTLATRVLRGFDDQLLTIAFSPDGSHLAAGSWNGDVRVLGLDRDQVLVLHGHEDSVWGVAYSPDGRLVASASGDGTVRLWEAATGRGLHRLRGHEAAVEGLAFSPDGGMLASAGWDKQVLLWDLGQDPPRLLRTLSGHEREVAAVSFSGDGALLASGGYDTTVRLWDVASGLSRGVLRGHRKAVRDVAFGRDGQTLLSSSVDGTVRVWDPRTGGPLRVLEGHAGPVTSHSLSPDGRWLASCSEDNSVRLWDLEQRATLPQDHGHTAQATYVLFSPDGQTLASTGYDKTLRLWDVATGAQRSILRGHTDTVFGLAYSPDGATLASSSYDKTIRLWNGATGNELKVLAGHTAMVDGLAFSPDGTHLASGGYDETVRLWDLVAGKELRQLRGHRGWVTGVAYSADGNLLASASFDQTVRLWDARSGAPRRVLRGHQSEVYSVAFDPRGRWLASAGADQELRLWDLKGQGSRVLGRHDGRIYRVAFDAAGEHLASVAADGTARIWSLASASSVTIHGPGGELNGVAFSPDGALLATTGDDASVQVWLAGTGQPYWRGVALLRHPVRFFTHRGWQQLEPGSAAGMASARHVEHAIARNGLRAELSADGRSLCLLGNSGRLELWDVAADRPLRSASAPTVHGLVALAGACAARFDDDVILVDASGDRRLGIDARALADSGAGLLLATDRSVIELDLATGQRRERTADEGITALLHLPAAIAVGYRDGNIDILGLDDGTAPATFTFEGVPASAVVRLAAGPRDTLIAGFKNGLVGIWSLDTGAQFHASKLHGSVRHLLLDGDHLYAGSELGDSLVLDLGTFDQDACALLRQVWASTPVVWSGGTAVEQAAPGDHPCAREP